MFSTMHNQKRAEQLVIEARNRIEEADRAFLEAKERLQQKVMRTDTVRQHIAQKSLEKLKSLFGRMKNEEPIELTPVSERSFAEQLQPLYEKTEIEPVVVENVRGGKAGAFFGSLLAVIVTFVAAMAIGAVGSGLPLSPETFTDKYKVLHILEWLGGGAWHTLAANPLFGAVGLLAALLAVWMITWSIMMGKSARRNLKRAEAIHEAAARYAEKRGEQTQTVEQLNEDLERLEKIYETCDIYLQEFNATIRRILHTEGDDFTAFKPASQRAVTRAAACAEGIAPILNIAIVTTEGTPSRQIERAVAFGESLVSALTEESKIPAYDAEELYAPSDDTPRESGEPIILPYSGGEKKESDEKESLAIEMPKEEEKEKEETKR